MNKENLLNNKKDLPDKSVRFLEIIKDLGLTAYKIDKNPNIKITNSGIANIKSGRNKPSDEVLESFLNEYKQVNRVWLFTGVGNKFNIPQGEKDDQEIKSGEAVKINPNIIQIPIVSQYAQAGYLTGFSDEEYMESLPMIPVFVDREPKGNYVAFETKGDSMDNGTDESIKEDDILIGREIRSDLWKYKLHIRKWNFIIVHKTEGILVKRIIEHDVENGIIIAHPLNPFYEDIKISLNDVSQLFNVVQIQRKPKM